MYNIGIDVHKEKCVGVIKGESPDVLKRTSFKNNASGITEFIDNLRRGCPTRVLMRDIPHYPSGLYARSNDISDEF